MKKVLLLTGKCLIVLLGVVVLFLAGTTVYHHLNLKSEAGDIVLKGTLVEVDDHKMNVYAEGEGKGKPTLVFLSGSGTAAPVYDFQPLFELLGDDYRIAVVEKAGYGYSETSDCSRDIDTMLDETRKALELAGETAPLVLFPHSMSALEALRWASLYPDEISAIIGLDMATPYFYDEVHASKSVLSVLSAGTWMGVHRIPLVYSVDRVTLDDKDFYQEKLLSYRNGFNKTMLTESLVVHENSDTVKSEGYPEVPMLLFTSNDEDQGEYWVPCMEAFAQETESELIYLDCSHYIHHFEYERIAEESRLFLASVRY